MNSGPAALCLAILVGLGSLSAAPMERVVYCDNAISIDADDVTMGRLLRLLDQATGLRSSISPELAKRTISVHFSRLRVNEAFQEIFRKTELDYVHIEGEGIIVTGVSRVRTAEAAPVEEDAPQVISEVLGPEIPEPRIEPPRRPNLIHTPFGPIEDTGGNRLIHLPPIPAEAPPPPFFARRPIPTPPAGAPNGPAQNDLFRPISIY